MRAVRFAVVVFLFAVAAVAAPGQFYWSSSYTTVNENAGFVTLNVFRTNGTTGAVTVDFATQSGSAVAGANYTAAAGTLSFADGEVSKPVTISIIDNTTYDGNKYFYVTLSNPTGGATIVNSTAQVTIIDNEVPPTVSIGDISVTEGNSGTTNAVFTVTISGTRTSNVSVSWYTSSGSAYSNSDFQYGSGTLTFTPSDTQKTIAIPVYGDTVYESNEYFYIYLSASNVVFNKYYASCTIVNDDTPPTVTADDVTIVEGNSGKTNAVVTLKSNQPLYSVDVYYLTVNGTAANGSDFDGVSGYVYFYGETQRTITIPINGDTNVEPDEQFKLHLSISYGNVTLPRSDINITIVNDDIGVGPPTQNVAKGSTAYVQVDLGNPPAGSNTLSIAVSDPCIKAPASVTIASRGVAIPVTAVDAPCSANVTITMPAALGGKTYNAGIRTYNPLTVAFDPPSPKIYAGQTLTVGITLAGLESPAQISLTPIGFNIQVPATVNVGPSGGSFTIKGLFQGPFGINVTLPTQNGGGIVQLFGEVVLPPSTVVITRVSPVAGTAAGGTSVAISGLNLASSCTFAFGGVPATNVVFANATTMTAATPAHAAGVVDVTATCGAASFTLANAFTYITGTPAVSGVAPSSGTTAGGTTVKISGRDLTPNCWAFFDGIPARNVVVLGGTAMAATAPAHAAAAVPVSVKCGAAGEASMANAFSYSTAEEPPPVITAVDPLTAAPGQPVTITGTRFRASDVVAFDAMEAKVFTPVGNGDTHTVALPPLPPGKVSVNVVDVSGRLSTTGPIFTVLDGVTPTVTKVTPASVASRGELTIDGSGFRAPYTFAWGDTALATVTMSYTRAVVRIPAFADGTHELYVVDGSARKVANGGNVTVTAAGVVVTSASPMCVTSDGGAAITITGSGFAPGATVTVGGVAATNVNVVDATRITATLPTLAPGWPTIVVTNPGDGSGSATNALRVYSPWDPDGCGVSPRPRPVRR